MQLKQTAFLTNRLKNFEGPNWSSRNRVTLYDHFRKNPIEAYKFLDKNVFVDDKCVTVNEAAVHFNYMEFLRFKGVKVGELIGYKDGLVFELIK